MGLVPMFWGRASVGARAATAAIAGQLTAASLCLRLAQGISLEVSLLVIDRACIVVLCQNENSQCRTCVTAASLNHIGPVDQRVT